MQSATLEGFKISRKHTLKELVADTVRNAIINGELKPGQQLFQEKIASTLEVSVIPVREALFSLREEGHVEYLPNRGLFVSKINRSDVSEMYEIRFFLESGALSLAIPNLQESDFAEADSLVQLCENADNVSDKRKWDLQLHTMLCKPCGRPRLLALIQQTYDHIVRYMNLEIHLMAFKTHPMYNHRLILQYCHERNIPGAIDAFHKHIEAAKSMIIANINGE